MNKLITTNRNKYQGTGLAVIALALSIPAGAQTNEQGQRASMLEEIVVTARRREESLQDTPITVTALSGTALEQRGVYRPTDLQFVAPSVVASPTLSRVGGGYTVRGLSSGVVTYFSEAPGGPTNAGMPFFDIESVQVLNGPQGTLFGRTAAAGAVLVEPRHPDLGEFGGYLDVTMGNYGRQETTASLNIPVIADELAVRVSYNREQIDGFTKPIAPSTWVDGLPRQFGLGKDFDSRDDESIRIAIEWQKGDFDTYLAYNYLDIDQTAPGWVLSAANLGVTNLNRTSPESVVNGSAQIRDVMSTELARIQSGGSIRKTPALQGLPGSIDRVKHESIINVAKYDFGDLGFSTLEAKNIFSYQENSGVTSYQRDGVGGLLLAIVGQTAGTLPAVNQIGNQAVPNIGDPIETVTEEFQLQGTAFEMIDFTLGYYYQNQKEPKNTEGTWTLVRSFSGLFTPSQGWSPGGPFLNGSEEEETAGYGQVTVDLAKFGLEGTTLTAGYRKTSNDQVDRNREIVRDPVTGTFFPGATIPEEKTGFNGDNYNFNITQQFTPEIMAYATYSESFVPGGTNRILGCEVAPGCEPTFAPSTAKNYEVGLKTEFQVGDADVRWNTNSYYLDFSDIQQTFNFQSGQINLAFTDNVAGAEMKGFETSLDVAWRNVALSMNYSHINAEYTKWVGADLNRVVLPSDTCLPGSAGNVCLIDLSGSSFTNTPKHQLSTSIRYDLPIDEAFGDIWVMLNAYYQTRQWHVQAPERELLVAEARGLGDITDAISQGAYAKFDARAGWDNILGSSFSGSIFVDNLTDKVYAQRGDARLHSFGVAMKLYAPPRMWGVNMRYDF